LAHHGYERTSGRDFLRRKIATMKNITVTISDELYLAARIWAAQNGTSVSKLVKDFLESIPDEHGSELKFPRSLYPLPPPYLP
jgi:hypothetical protein